MLIRLQVLAVLLTLPLSAGAGVVKLTIDGVIHPMSDEYLARGIERASTGGHEAVLIELRTPGGLESSTRRMVNRMLDSPVPVIVWVAPSGSRAASAGFFLLQAADVAAMAPGTNTGAAHPVVLGGEKIDEIMMTKMENDSAAFMRTIAARRGRNVEVAESAVRESKSFTESEALEQNLIDLVARSQTELFAALDGKEIRRFGGETSTLALGNAEVVEIERTVKERLLGTLMDPNVAFVLLSLGMLALWAEFNNPGAILPGVVGVLCLILAVFALNILPTRFAAVALILLAFILFALEAQYASHGVLGAGGIASMIIGGLLLVDGPIPELQVHYLTAIAVSIPFGIIAIVLATLVLRAHKRRVVTGEEGMVGEIGIAESVLDPAGKVFVHGEIWSARSDSPVPKGTRIVVRGMSGLQLTVAAATEDDIAAAAARDEQLSTLGS